MSHDAARDAKTAMVSLTQFRLIKNLFVFNRISCAQTHAYNPKIYTLYTFYNACPSCKRGVFFVLANPGTFC